MPTWQATLLKTAGFGSGAVLTAIAASFAYYSLPHAEKPWNRDAISATYKALTVNTSERVNVHISYLVHNSTERDYVLPTDINAVFIKSPDNSAIYNLANSTDPYLRDLTIDQPPFVPARRSAVVTINLSYDYNDNFPKSANVNLEQLASYMGKRLKEVGGFEVFDRANRYQVIMPTGKWNVPEVNKTNK